MNKPLKESNPTKVEYFKDIAATVREPLLVLDADLRVLDANHSFYKFFKVKPKETVGALIYDLGSRQWDIPSLRLLLETILPKKAVFNDYNVEYDFPSIGRRILLLNARRIPRLPNKNQRILLAFEDVTERRQLERSLQASEERFHQAFETAQDSMLLVEKTNGIIVNSNQSAEESLGYSKQSLQKKNLWELGILKDEEQFRQTSLELEEQGFVRLDDLIIPTHSGGHFPADIYLLDKAAVFHCNIRDVSERKQAEGVIRDLARFPTENPNPVMRIARGGTLLYANEAASVQLADWNMELSSLVPKVLNDSIQEVFTTGIGKTIELTCGRRIFSFSIESTSMEMDVSVYGRDITKSKQAEKLIEKLSQILHTLSDINQAIVRMRAGQALCQEACRIAVDVGGFRMAWIGFLDEETMKVKPEAWAGIVEDYLDEQDVTVRDEAKGRGPSGTTLREGHHEICNDIEHEPRMEPRRADALRLGYRSSAAFPLRISGKVRGTFTLYASETDFFNEEEVKLLDEMAQDLSFAMEFTEEESRRKQAEEILRETDERFHSLFKNMINGLAYCQMLYDQGCPQDFIYLEVNDAFEKLTGLKNVIGKKVSEVIPGIRESDPVLFETYGRVARSGNPESFEIYLEAMKMWLSISVYSPRKEYFVAIFDVITVHKRAEEALLESELRYRTLAEASSDMIFVIDRDHRMQYVNTFSARQFGLTQEQVIGLPLNKLFPPDLAEQLEHTIHSVFAGSQLLAFDRLLRFGQREIWVSSSLVPLRDESGAVNAVMGISRDITERKLAEEEILQLNASLELRIEERTCELREAQEQMVRKEKLAVLGQLAGGVGHELRNPLGVISNSIYYLKLVQPDANEKIKKHHDMIEQEVHNAAKIVTDLLDYARVVSTDRKLGSALELVEHTLSRFPVPASIPVSLKIPANLPQVYADPLHVEQVLGNLTTNACHAMINGGKLTITVQQEKQMVAIAVKDTGTGISLENIQKLFEPLFSTKVTGIGLGLAVSKKLAELNGGRIEVESEVGKGSTFTLYLPVQNSKADYWSIG